MSKIGILVIHGMGDQKREFYDGFAGGIKHFYNALGENENDLEFMPIWWASILSNEERQIIERTRQGNLNFINTLRPFVVNYLADVIAYQKTFEKKDYVEKNKGVYGDRGIYHIIQALISSSIKELKNKIGSEKPIIMIGHSLGSVMLLNYLHDVEKSESKKEERDWDYEDKFNLAGLITMGCPLALWLLRYKEFGKAIRFPLESTRPEFYQTAKWINYYDKDDILAYPLKELNDTYRALNCLEDIQVNAGSVMESWNPLSHNGYFRNFGIMEETANYLLKIRKIME
jgi:hypothetical protein